MMFTTVFGFAALPIAFAATHDVSVGAGGLFAYDPQFVTAAAGDVINFVLSVFVFFWSVFSSYSLLQPPQKSYCDTVRIRYTMCPIEWWFRFWLVCFSLSNQSLPSNILQHARAS